MRSALCAMFTAWSPTRSRSPEMRIALTMNRRSRAIGCCSASSEIASCSISTSSRSTSASAGSTASAFDRVTAEERLHRRGEQFFGKLRHVEQPLLEQVELLVERLVARRRFVRGHPLPRGAWPVVDAMRISRTGP